MTIAALTSRLANSDKCCTGSFGTVNACYILRQPDSSNGNGLAVEVRYGTGSTLSNIAAISLVPMFRMMFADTTFLNSLSFAEQPKNSNELSWNPGLYINDRNYLEPFTFPSPYIELNLSANQLQSFKNRNIILYRATSHDLYASITNIKATILEPKMMITSSTDTIDFVTISYNARVDIYGSYHYKRRPSSTAHGSKALHLYWTTPYIISFMVDKSTLTESTYTISNYCWSYCFDVALQSHVGKIDASISPAISAAGYNYSIIPKITYSETVAGQGDITAQWPISFGCKVDFVTDDASHQRTLVASCYGYYDALLRKYRTINILSSISFTSYFNGIYHGATFSTVINLSSAIDNNRLVNKVSLYRYLNTLVMAVSFDTGTSNTNPDSDVILKHVDISLGVLSVVPYYNKFTMADNCIVTSGYSNFMLTLSDYMVGRRKIIEYPSGISSSSTISLVLADPPGITTKTYITDQYVNNKFSYKPVGSTVIYYPNKIINKELYPQIEEVLYNTVDVYAKPIDSGAILLDYPSKTFDVNAKFYAIPSTGLAYQSTPIKHIYSSSEWNKSNQFDCFVAKNTYSNNILVTDEVLKYTILPFDVATYSAIDTYFWLNPIFSTSDVDLNDPNIKVVITLVGCTGVYASGIIAGGDAWNNTARPAATYPDGSIKGGIPLDFTKTRDDIDIRYYGTETDYLSQISTSGGGYYLSIENYADVKLTYKGSNILAGVDSNYNKRLYPICWKYTESGVFNLNLDVSLNLNGVIGDDAVSDYTDGSFSMTNCMLSLDIKNKYGTTISKITNAALNITPPTTNASIDSNSITKTISSPTFRITRKSSDTSVDFTTIRNAKFHHYRQSTGQTTVYDAVPAIITDRLPSTDSQTIDYTFSSAQLERGDYVYMTAEPRLYDSRAGGLLASNKVSFCSGHRYSVSSVQVKHITTSGSSGIMPNSVVYDAESLTPNIQCLFSISKETWSNRDSMRDTDVYPLISSIYVFAIQAAEPATSFSDPYDRFSQIVYKNSPPASLGITYPNHTEEFGTLLYRKFLEVSGVNSSMISGLCVIDSAIVEIGPSTYSYTLTISQQGEYQIYAIVVDEFDQKSCFCLTNSLSNYNIPFRR